MDAIQETNDHRAEPYLLAPGEIRRSPLSVPSVKADSHDAAAKLFEKHPHFTIFPGDSVEIMEILPIPGQP